MTLKIPAKPHWKAGQTLRLSTHHHSVNDALIVVAAWLLCGLFAGLTVAWWFARQFALSPDVSGLLGAITGLALAMRFCRYRRRSGAIVSVHWQDQTEDSVPIE